jgi:asparagine synthase (glutamine-hydrolysing)
MDALRVHPGITAKLCDAYIGDYLLIGCNMHPALTAFEQIERLPPAHTLAAWQERVSFTRYWSFPIEEPLRYRRSREYVDEFRGLLNKAVEDRLRTDRASISLSGGLDSTTVAAEATRQLGVPGNLLGATYGFNRAIRDPEPPLARRVADYLGIRFHYLAGDDYGLFDRCDSLAGRFPWPTDLALAAPVCDVYDIIAGHGRLLLTGEGGDFGFVPSLAVHCGARVFRLHWDVGKYILTHGHLPRVGFRVTWQRWRGTSPKEVPPYPQWFEPEFESQMNLRDRYRELVREPPQAHPFRPDSYSSLSSPFVSTLFENYDAGYRRLPLEVRHPLFDLRIQRFFLRLPMLPWCADKELLRVAMRGRLPVEILRRPKTPVKGNPLWGMLQEGDADRLDNFPQASGFEYYVARDKIKAAWKERDVKNLESHFRAVSLNYWLQSIQPIR